MKSLFEQNGGTCSTIGDYCIPNLTAPGEPEHHIGVWGQRRFAYLKKHRRVLYINLLTSGKLPQHLCGIDIAACERWESIVQQMAESQDVTERLKSENQILWVSRMNNIHACTEEILLNELIYN